jgi:hypothetical protein
LPADRVATITRKVSESFTHGPKQLTFSGGINHVNLNGKRDSWTVGPSLTYEIGF